MEFDGVAVWVFHVFQTDHPWEPHVKVMIGSLSSYTKGIWPRDCEVLITLKRPRNLTIKSNAWPALHLRKKFISVTAKSCPPTTLPSLHFTSCGDLINPTWIAFGKAASRPTYLEQSHHSRKLIDSQGIDNHWHSKDLKGTLLSFAHFLCWATHFRFLLNLQLPNNYCRLSTLQNVKLKTSSISPRGLAW